MPEPEAVRHVAPNVRCGEGIGFGALLTGILVDGLIGVTEALSENRVVAVDENAVEEHRLRLAVVLHLINKIKRKPVTQIPCHRGHFVQQVLRPYEHLIVTVESSL